MLGAHAHTVSGALPCVRTAAMGERMSYPYGGHPPFGQAPPGATHQGWGGPPPSGPGKKTMGVLAGVLAIFCFILLATTCGVSLFQIIRTQIDTNPMTRAYPTHVAVTVACVLAALLFLIGAIRHLKRGRSGSVIVLVAAVIVVAVAVLQWVDMTAAPGDETVFATSFFEVIGVHVVALFGIPAGILALNSRLWLVPKRPRYPQPPGWYGRQPGY